jgi:SAM-dependent methyltransferase
MALLRWLRDRLVEPRLLSVEIDADQRIEAHRHILLEKPSLQRLFREVYRLCVDLDDRYFSGGGPRVELGAGSSIFKEFSPKVIATDVEPAPHLDMVVDALRLPFRAASIRAFYGIECFHHLNDPHLFFTELRRTLLPGGGCVLIEPYHGRVARQVYPRLLASESFDPDQIEWRTPTAGPMLGANQALSYIVFTRDRETFQAQYPDLRIVREFPLNNYLRYLGSGGVNFRALLPDFLVPVARLGEIALSPLNRIVALHHVIVLRYEPVPPSEVSKPADAVVESPPPESN